MTDENKLNFLKGEDKISLIKSRMIFIINIKKKKIQANLIK